MIAVGSARLAVAFGRAEPDPAVLGGKGAGLARMVGLGLPVPPGFTITTEAWRSYRDAGVDDVPDEVLHQVDQQLARLSEQLGRSLDDGGDPLLLSVRSGAAVSMPGMMDTVLNVGLTDDAVRALVARGEHFAIDAYGRLLDTYARVVLGADLGDAERPRTLDEVLALRASLAARGIVVPQSGREQIIGAVRAVWRSWDSDRARRYRRYRGIDEQLGTAVTVQAMVFGNRNQRSGTGVVFTRDPSTGEPGVYGDFLVAAQGEDVVDGSVTPLDIGDAASLLPDAFAELHRHLGALEQDARDMCDVEFTIEDGRLWILQTRVGQRTGLAAIRIAHDLVEQGLIDVDEALRRIPLDAFEQIGRPVLVPEGSPAATGIGASPGVAIGAAVFDAERAEQLADQGQDVVLVRPETSPEDLGGMIAARGIVTATGGRASHAAVVARGIGRPAVCGVDGLEVDERDGSCRLPDGARVRDGDLLTIDGTIGEVRLGAGRLEPATTDPVVDRVLAWCDERARIPLLTDVAPPGATLVSVDWEGQESNAALAEACAAAGDGDLALRLPPSLRGAEITPPRGRWVAIVAEPAGSPVARALAARIEVGEPEAPGAAATTDGGAAVDPSTVIHALRIKGRADAEAVAAATGSALAAVTAAIAELERQGLAALRGKGRRAGWMLTREGRAEHERTHAAVDGDDHARLDAAYQGFLRRNGQVKSACTRWQLADESERAEIAGELTDLVGETAPSLEEAGTIVARFARYRERLVGAAERIATDGRYAVSPFVDSVHTVWFECHEDFLMALGRTRQEEGSGSV